jgi:hypothetical protein
MMQGKPEVISAAIIFHTILIKYYFPLQGKKDLTKNGL